MSKCKEEITKEDLMLCNETFCALESKMIIYEQCDLLKIIKDLVTCNCSVGKKCTCDRMPINRDSLLESKCLRQSSESKCMVPVALYFDPIINPAHPNRMAFQIQAVLQDIENQFALNQQLQYSRTEIIDQTANAPLDPTALSPNPPVPPVPPVPPYALLATIDNRGFEETDLQFHQLVVGPYPFHENLNKIEVGYWELLELIRYSDYIGISGARVSTGNHRVLGNSPYVDYCNEDHFTLKFSGLTKFPNSPINDVPPSDKQPLILVPNNSPASYSIRRKGASNKKIIQNSNKIIPGTVWGSPCPPHWIPQ